MISTERLIHRVGARAVSIRCRINLLASHTASKDNGSLQCAGKGLASLELGIDRIQQLIQLRERGEIISVPVVIYMELPAKIITRVIVVAIVEAGALRRLQIINNLPHNNSWTSSIATIVILKRIGRAMPIVGCTLRPFRGKQRLLRPYTQGTKQKN